MGRRKDNRRDSSEFGEPVKYDPDFNGPLKRRSCTDVLCLLLFGVFVGCWIGVGIYAIKEGDPESLLAPRDSEGRRCGIDTQVADKPYLVFFDLTKCISPSVLIDGCSTPQACVEKCPKGQFLIDFVQNDYEPADMICKHGIKIPQTYQEAQNRVKENVCARWYLPSVSVQKRCVPNVNENVDEILNAINITMVQLIKIIDDIKIITNAAEIGSDIVDDVIDSWWKILVGLAIAMVACIIYIMLMRWLAGIMVWISIVGVIGVLSYCVYATAAKYKDVIDHPSNDKDSQNATKNTWLAALIISSVVLALILLILLFLRKRIIVAIALIKEASKAVSAVTAALFFPLFPWILQLGVVAYAVVVAVYLLSVGETQYVVKNKLNDSSCECTEEAVKYMDNMKCEPHIFSQNCHIPGFNLSACTNASCTFDSMDKPPLMPYLHVFNVFGFFWGLFFVSAMGEMILASTFATWYWTFKKSNVPFFTVTAATARTLRYHLGTLAFGALIITICRMIRLALEYIDQQLKKYENPVTKAILCCCKCFFWCLENFLKFINRNAYIMCAIYGKNFCTSAKDAFGLLMRNIVRVFVLDKVTDFLLFLSKVLITAGVTCLSYTVFVSDLVEHVDKNELNYNLTPVIIIAIGTYLIATVFFSVFTMAVDTLFLCFLEDSERNDGSREKPYYMSKQLMQILGKKNKKN